MRRTNAAYSSFLTRRRGRFDVNPALTVSGLVSWAAGDELSSWLLACRALVSVRAERAWRQLLPATWPRRRGASSDSCRKRLEGQDCQGWRLRHRVRRACDSEAALDRPDLEGYTIGSG
jgi:hypothetical protein